MMAYDNWWQKRGPWWMITNFWLEQVGTGEFSLRWGPLGEAQVCEGVRGSVLAVPRLRHLWNSQGEIFSRQQDTQIQCTRRCGLLEQVSFHKHRAYKYKIELSCQKESSHSVVGSGMTSQRLYWFKIFKEGCDFKWLLEKKWTIWSWRNLIENTVRKTDNIIGDY